MSVKVNLAHVHMFGLNSASHYLYIFKYTYSTVLDLSVLSDLFLSLAIENDLISTI